MTRVKGGPTRVRRHKKILKLARGYRGAKHRQYKRAKEAVLHAGQYAWAGRRFRKRQMRSLWVIRINSALAPYQLSYSKFIHLLKEAKLNLDRKVLAQLALEEPEIFKKIVEKVSSKSVKLKNS